MATPLRRARRTTSFVPTLPPRASLDEAFLDILAAVAQLPARYGSQEDHGAVNDAGLDPIGLRRFCLAWCDRMTARQAFPLDELRGLQAALQDFTDEELVGLTKGAIFAGHR